MKGIYTFILSISSVTFILAQNQDTIIYNLDKHEYRIVFEKIQNKDDFSSLNENNLPIFVFDSTNMRQVHLATKVLTIQNRKMKILEKDLDLVEKLESEYDTLLRLNSERVEIYEEAYNKLKIINTELKSQLDLAIDVGRNAAKRSKSNGVLLGIMGGIVTGVTIGVVVSN